MGMSPRLHQVISLAFASALAFTLVSPNLAAAEPAENPNGISVPNLLQISKNQETVPGKWMVKLRPAPQRTRGIAPRSVRSQSIESQAQQLENQVDSKEVKVTDTFDTLWNGVAVDASEKGLEQIAQADNVADIYPVLVYHLPKTVPSSINTQNVTPQTSNARTVVQAQDLKLGETNLTGEGIKIGIVDTGIDLNHGAFGGDGNVNNPANQVINDTRKVVAGYDFIDYDALPEDCTGHGTHVAGIAAGNDSIKDFKGLAPEAKLGVYRIFDCENKTRSNVVLAALDRALKDGMDVVNLSLSESFDSWGDEPLQTAVNKLVSSGVTVVAAAGNEGGDTATFTAGSPSIFDDAISVGATTNNEPTETQTMAFFSSYGLTGDLRLKPDVSAPGAPVSSAQNRQPHGYVFMSGTSMATPVVAGAVALLKQAVPEASPQQIRQALMNTANPLKISNVKAANVAPDNTEEVVHQQGGGLINLPATLAQLSANQVSVTPALSLGAGAKKTLPLTITNHGDSAVTYTLAADTTPAATTGTGLVGWKLTGLNTGVSFTQGSINLAPGSSATVSVKVTAPTHSSNVYSPQRTESVKSTPPGYQAGAVPGGSIYGGYVELRQNGEVVKRVPFTGMTGRYKDRNVFGIGWKYSDVYTSKPRWAASNETMDSYIYPQMELSRLVPGGCRGTLTNLTCQDTAKPSSKNELSQYVSVTNSSPAANRVFTFKDAYNVPVIRFHIDSPVNRLTVRVYKANSDGSKGDPLYRSRDYSRILDWRHLRISGNFPYQETFVWDPKTGAAEPPEGRYILEAEALDASGEIISTFTSPSLEVTTKDNQVTPKLPYRVSGATRVETSLAAFQYAKYPKVAVLASGLAFPDGTTGGALAGALGTTVVQTVSRGLEPQVLQALRNAGTQKVYVIGGTGAISTDKENALRNAGMSTVRLGGNDRYQTAALVKNETIKVLQSKGSTPQADFWASGSDFPDAMTSSAAAARMNGVVTLIRPGQQAAITTKTYCAGGQACAAAPGNVTRLVGRDRYQTAERVSSVTPASANASVIIASGRAFPDTLSAGGLAGCLDARLYLTAGSSVNVPVSTRNFIRMGGSAVIPDYLHFNQVLS